jgi:inosine-uridine nucleoside N-ribohydrolase
MTAETPSMTARRTIVERRQRVVLDMDVGIDDALAILYLAARPDVEVVALGSVHGNGYIDVTTRNALIVLELAGLGHVPVARGAAEPLEVPLSVATFVHGEDGLGDAALPDPVRVPTPESAADQLIRLGVEAPGTLDLLAVGPLTNLGLALRRDPETLARYRSVVIMGGAGMEADDARSIMDANIAHDPDAADLVFATGADITMVGVNVTTPTLLEAPDQARIAASDLPHARFAWRILGFYLDFYERFMGRRVASLHDPLAAGILRDPSYVSASVDAPVGLVESELGARAVAPVDPSAAVAARWPTHVVTAVDGPRFVEDFVDALVAPLPTRPRGPLA